MRFSVSQMNDNVDLVDGSGLCAEPRRENFKSDLLLIVELTLLGATSRVVDAGGSDAETSS